MRQRVAIAIALSCEPKLLIADEPTTALDVTIQAQILDLLAREQRRRHMAMILITHDLGVVAGRTDEVAVMYAGRVVERAPTPALFKKMRMPYTEALLAALPRLDAAPHTPLPAISGRPPDPTRPLQGCSFSPRCRYAAARCRTEKAGAEVGRDRAHISTPASIRSMSMRGPAHDAASRVGRVRRAAARRRRSGRRISRRQEDRSRRIWRVVADRPRRDTGAGRRIRLRKIDAGPGGAAVAPADRRGGFCSTVTISRRCRATPCG